MALADFLAELDALAGEATATLTAAADAAAIEAARIQFLGMKSGRLRVVQTGLGGIPKADRPAAGKRFNEVKAAIEAALEAAQARLASAAGPQAGPTRFDPTVPGHRPRLGHVHPISQTIEDLKDIMGRLGFTVAYGPEVEDEWHNFEALNIPLEHPARDPLDNFYLATPISPLPPGDGQGVKGNTRAASPATRPHPRAPTEGWSLPEGEGTSHPHPDSLPEGEGDLVSASPRLRVPASPRPGVPVSSRPLVRSSAPSPGPFLLRSQTSTVQIRVMERTPPPVRIISLGRVYRPDDADATHYPMFHQIEGLLVDRQATLADLKSVLRLFARSFFQDDVHIRFRPSFFPFTEPSVEVDMSWHGRWIEMGGAGMVDPNVFRAVGYDPEQVSGFAFGLGIERVCARRHNVTDIREFFKNDVRFLEQF
jgi:phenylalanyl-tRNA synthetase alpha chain